mmetsp:Transcript_4918/g.31456  ORF Transcript_4918/g.31456 Transcript_4918/m.31456 type:complete len:272 (-) Transcript_4918:3233-4048(-)
MLAHGQANAERFRCVHPRCRFLHPTRRHDTTLGARIASSIHALGPTLQRRGGWTRLSSPPPLGWMPPLSCGWSFLQKGGRNPLRLVDRSGTTDGGMAWPLQARLGVDRNECNTRIPPLRTYRGWWFFRTNKHASGGACVRRLDLGHGPVVDRGEETATGGSCTPSLRPSVVRVSVVGPTWPPSHVLPQRTVSTPHTRHARVHVTWNHQAIHVPRGREKAMPRRTTEVDVADVLGKGVVPSNEWSKENRTKTHTKGAMQTSTCIACSLTCCW